MHFTVLLFVLALVLKTASFTHGAFRKYIAKAGVRILIKTADGRRARLFIFDKGKFSSEPGDHASFDVALVWKDANTGFFVMLDKHGDASFNAAAEGKLRVEGMSVFAQWFETGMKLIM